MFHVPLKPDTFFGHQDPSTMLGTFAVNQAFFVRHSSMQHVASSKIVTDRENVHRI